MPDRQMPKRTAIMLISLLFVVLYTVSIILLIFFKKSDSSYLSGDASKETSTSQIDTSSIPGLFFEQNSNDTSTESNSSDVILESSDNSSSSEESDIGSSSNSNDTPQNNSNNNSSNTESSSTPQKPVVSTPKPSTPTVTPSKVDFSASIWISVFDMADLGIKGMTKQEFQTMIDEMFDNSVSLGIDTVFCQVRPYGDAFYSSNYFPYSSMLTGTEGKNPGYDPLKIMVSSAHKRGLEIHAWINPYRISVDSTDLSKLADSNPAKIWLTDNNTANDRYVLSNGRGLYYNPAILEVQKLIINGVREICENYDVDGIHIDDYFYPDGVTDSFDSVEYTASGKILSLADWRRANVNALVAGMYSAVKSYGLTFGISPAGNISRNYTDLYADVAKWISTPGYTDYIIPQIYFGYNYPNSQFAYKNMLTDWMNLARLSSVKMYIGLGNYKIDNPETAKNPSTNKLVTNYEWINETDVIARQTKDAYDKKADGVVLFSYGSVFGKSKNQIAQTNNFKEALTNIKD